MGLLLPGVAGALFVDDGAFLSSGKDKFHAGAKNWWVALARRVTRWSRECDGALLRLIGYLQKTMGAELVHDEVDVDSLKIVPIQRAPKCNSCAAKSYMQEINLFNRPKF